MILITCTANKGSSADELFYAYGRAFNNNPNKCNVLNKNNEYYVEPFTQEISVFVKITTFC